MEISEKVAYLKGLAEGLNLDTDSKEGKLIAAIIDVLDDMPRSSRKWTTSCAMWRTAWMPSATT